MAKINSDTITITVSQLLKDTDQADKIFDVEVVDQLQAIIQELVGKDVLVEIVER
jgi:hypothetical protein